VLPSGRIPQLVIDKMARFAVGDKQFLEQSRSLCPTLKQFVEWNRKEGLIFRRSGTPFARKKILRDVCYRRIELRYHRESIDLLSFAGIARTPGGVPGELTGDNVAGCSAFSATVQ
jgi:hypothetical protein